MDSIIDFFINAYRNMPTYQVVLEILAFIFGILSVWYARNEDILVYPTGIIGTGITVYLLFINGYLGDMMMNVYYSVMSIYGWWNWARKKEGEPLVPITRTTTKEKVVGFGLFLMTMVVTYMVYVGFNYEMEIPNYIDIFTSGVFFTAMWYMANKKLENWTLWILANVITVPLYAYRGLGILSVQYIIFTILAVQGFILWKRSLNNTPQTL